MDHPARRLVLLVVRVAFAVELEKRHRALLPAGEDQAAQSAVELGADAYLTKPLELNDLFRVIADLNSGAGSLR